ncbi:hypothetical protein GCM10011348_14230 [Marinobacterium nitratireducens]|uniref:SIS domain-containing protein n=1 Tax=Marinobacterium nitratireducens TaxID=518897 RepID=A0A917ZD44_9GAMM|nr:hypothetical protein [Marinobacterium nitratireducens]GGO79585.1 hypothetical protein GCM10011348_14230 [Marinobacterium nitratireducens]
MSELSITALVDNGGDVLQSGYASLREQARMLERLAASIDESFVRAVRLVTHCRGEIIVAGNGVSQTRLAKSLSAAGCKVREVEAGNLHGRPGAAVGSDDLVIVVGADAQQALQKPVTSLLLIGGSAESASVGQNVLALPVSLDTERCPAHLQGAVQELAVMAQADALAAAVAVQYRRNLPSGERKNNHVEGI